MPDLLVDELESSNELRTSNAGTEAATEVPVVPVVLEVVDDAKSPPGRHSANKRSRAVVWVYKPLRRMYREVLVPLSWY